MITKNQHASNPNPQPIDTKYRSANQIGQSGGPNTESERKMMQMLRFGRRVIFDRQITNKDLLKEHLKTIHQQSEERKTFYDTTKRAEREYIDRRKREED